MYRLNTTIVISDFAQYSFKYGVSQKKLPQNPKREAYLTKTYSQGIEVIALGKSNRPRVPRPVEMINFIKIFSRKDSKWTGH